MELETLEVLLDVNTARVEESLERVLPQIESTMNRIQQMSGNSMDRTEKNMNIERGANNFSKQLDKMNQTLEKTMANFEKTTKQSSTQVGDNFSSGIRKARPKVTKEIDAMVNEINAKMGQAKAAQEKVAYLKSQRQSASSAGDTGRVVKYDEQIARTQAQMSKFEDQAKEMANTIKREFDAVPSSLDTITKSMAQNEGQIEAMRKRIKTLKAEYAEQRKPVGSFSSGFNGSEDTPQSLKTSAEIEKQSAKMAKLISSNDRLQKEYAQTEDRATSLRKALARINNTMSQSSIQTGSAANGATQTGTGLKQSERAVSKYGGVFNRMSNAVSHGFGGIGNGLKSSLGFIGKFGSLFSNSSKKVTAGNNQMMNSTNAFGQSMRYLLPSLVVYQLLGGAIRTLAGGMFSALKTNDQFSASLNQIKVNLMTAFYPIYTAILPAVNALMSALAQLTGQFASFIAGIFGTNYEAAKAGASSLYDNVQALEDTGSSADKAKEKVKKFQKSLMGFDQINKLNLDSGDDDKKDTSLDSKNPAIDFGKATSTYTTPKWMLDIQKLLKDFFKPFKDAWKNQGQKVIDAWKYALGEVIGLASAIGKSFMEVWTNGTGQLFIENLLILLADVLNIVGDIAGAFKRAWEDNGRGTRLIQSIFDMFNRILELLHEIAVAFRNAWNDGRGESIAANILEIFTNIFNTVGNLAAQLKKAWKEGKTGESIFGTILDVVDDLLGNINSMTKATSEWAKTLDFTPLLKSIDKLLKSIRPITKNIGDGLEWLYQNVLLPFAGFVIEDYVPKFFELLAGALDVLNQVIEILKPIFKWFWDVVLQPLVTIAKFLIIEQFEFFIRVLKKLSDILGVVADAVKNPKKAISDLGDLISLKFDQIKKTVYETWSKVTTWTSKTWNGAKDTVKTKATEIWDNVKNRWTDIKKNTRETWDNFSSKVSDKARSAKDNASSRIRELKNNVSDRWNETWSKTRTIWDNVKDKVTTKSGEARDRATSAFRTLRSNLSTSLEGVKKTASDVFGKIGSWAADLPGRIAKGLRNGVKSIKSAAASIGNGIVGVVGRAMNGVINGINWVLGKVGAGKSKLKLWTIPKYAKGTGHHPGGPALVNDGLGSNYREAYRTPDGRTGIFPAQRNLMVNLPPGTSVLSGPKTAAMYGVPAYASGIGEWFKEKWNGAKEIASDVWSYASNPKKLLNAAVSKFVDLKNAVEPSLSMAKGSVGTIAEGAYNWVKSKFDAGYKSYQASLSGGDGSHDGSMGGWGVYKYLYNVAQKTMKRFPGMVITSGQRNGDPYSHGKHMAIDIAYPASMNGSRAYFGPANYAFEQFPSQVAYVITQGKVRDRKGMSGTGASGKWTRWPDNDHYDHLHINGSLGANDIAKKGSGIGSEGGQIANQGSGVERWRGTVNKALKMLGIYSVVNANRTLYQMKTESGGNPNAINNWDINAINGTPSKGLMQVIDPTFRSYARSPYNKNIWDPMSNILASMRYALSRYGSLAKAYRGVGYENGGLVTQDGLYRMGEGNKKEMIIPLEKPNRAAELIQQAIEYLGLDVFDSTITLPELFQEPRFTPSNNTFSTNEQMNYQSGGMQDFTSAMVTTLMNAISAMGATPTQTPNGDIIINIGGKEFGRIAVKEINKYHQQLGYTELNI